MLLTGLELSDEVVQIRFMEMSIELSNLTPEIQ
jgi:hypothetical protein